MRKIFLFLLLLITCCKLVIAQKNDVDSLQKAYQKSKQDTTLVNLLLERSKVYLYLNTDSGMTCAHQSLALSRKIHYKLGEVRSLAGIATFLNIMGDLPGTLRQTFEVLPMAIKINDKRTVAACYNNFGLTYNILKDYKKSLENYHKALAITEQAHLYDLEITENNNISRTYLDNNRLDSALFYTERAYALSQKYKYLNNVGYLIRNFGIIEFKKRNYPRAINYYIKSVQSMSGKNNHYLLSEDYRRLGEAYQSLNKTDSCIDFAKKGFEEAKLDRNPELVLKATSLLTSVFKSIDNYKEAYNYEQIMLKAQDSLFSQQKTLQIQTLAFNQEQQKREIESSKIAYQTKVRFYSLLSVLGVLILIASILVYANQKRKKANDLLKYRNQEIETQRKSLQQTLEKLKTTQTQLIQSEKMASLGELTAGIAHEIQNPLNFVNNFSEVNTEMIEELEAEISSGNTSEALSIAADIKENEKKINHHGKRADFIVKGMLLHSRTSTGERQLTDINVLADEFLKLSFHGLRAKDKSFNAEMVTHFDTSLPRINIVQQDIGRVLLNLFNNAFYAVNQKQKTTGSGYKPEVSVSTAFENGHVTITVKDNGIGIPDAIKEKIMQPFFTTKPTGEGTGLGLSLTYDMVVKGHGGSIALESVENKYTTFTIVLPYNN